MWIQVIQTWCVSIPPYSLVWIPHCSLFTICQIFSSTSCRHNFTVWWWTSSLCQRNTLWLTKDNLDATFEYCPLSYWIPCCPGHVAKTFVMQNAVLIMYLQVVFYLSPCSSLILYIFSFPLPVLSKFLYLYFPLSLFLLLAPSLCHPSLLFLIYFSLWSCSHFVLLSHLHSFCALFSLGYKH